MVGLGCFLWLFQIINMLMPISAKQMPPATT